MFLFLKHRYFFFRIISIGNNSYKFLRGIADNV